MAASAFPQAASAQLSSAFKFKLLSLGNDRSLMKSQHPQERKAFNQTPWAYVMATVLGGVLGGPPGALLSPLALVIANRKGEFLTEKGQKVTPITMWVAIGLVFTPLCWYLNNVIANNAPPAPAPFPAPVPAGADAPQSRQLMRLRFGKGDDAAALLERCSRPDRDYDSGNEVPRPPIVMRNMEYRSQGVRVWFAPRDWGWKLMFFQDLVTGKGITPEEGMRRLGNACR